MRVRALLPAALLAATLSPHTATAQPATPLHDGQMLTLRGTLQLRPQGRLQFVTVQTKAAYLPMTGTPNHAQKRTASTHDVALSGYHRYDLLAAHRGQNVTVTGKVMTDDVSPYYYRNISLSATSICLEDGTELLGEGRVQDVDAAVKQVSVTVLLPADLAAPWRYTGAGFTEDHRPAVCSSNGGGDVVNCYCPLNFTAAEASMTKNQRQTPGRRMEQMAQFAVGDTASAVTLQLTCTR